MIELGKVSEETKVKFQTPDEPDAILRPLG